MSIRQNVPIITMKLLVVLLLFYVQTVAAAPIDPNRYYQVSISSTGQASSGQSNIKVTFGFYGANNGDGQPDWNVANVIRCDTYDYTYKSQYQYDGEPKDCRDVGSVVRNGNGDHTFYDNSVERGKYYWYKVQFCDDYNCSQLFGPPQHFDSDSLMLGGAWIGDKPVSPYRPNTVRATKGTLPNSVTITWQGMDPRMTDGFEVLRCTDTTLASCSKIKTNMIPDQGFEDPAPPYIASDWPPTRGTHYYYRVRACAYGGESSGYSTFPVPDPNKRTCSPESAYDTGWTARPNPPPPEEDPSPPPPPEDVEDPPLPPLPPPGPDKFILFTSRTGSGSGTVSTRSSQGINCGNKCSELYKPYSSVTLSATPDFDSTFTGWFGGGCTGNQECRMTMTGNRHVVATFTKKNSIAPVGPPWTKPANPSQFALFTPRIGSGSGRITSSPSGINCGADCSNLYAPGTLVTLTAVPLPGSIFSGWLGGGCTDTDTETCTVTVNTNVTVAAHFMNVCIPPLIMPLLLAKPKIAPGLECGENKVYDCVLKCIKKNIALDWIGDGFCDDGTYGMDLRCSAFRNDAGDCN